MIERILYFMLTHLSLLYYMHREKWVIAKGRGLSSITQKKPAYYARAPTTKTLVPVFKTLFFFLINKQNKNSNCHPENLSFFIVRVFVSWFGWRTNLSETAEDRSQRMRELLMRFDTLLTRYPELARNLYDTRVIAFTDRTDTSGTLICGVLVYLFVIPCQGLPRECDSRS